MSPDQFDIIVVGGGPVGLHAALKGAVLNHTVLLVDKGRSFSRVSQAPAIANIPGAPGISGVELLEKGRRDLREFEKLSGKELVTLLEETEAVGAERLDGGGFSVRVRSRDGSEREARGDVLILATGTVDRKPGIGEFYREGHRTLGPYIGKDHIGYCVLCEGWSVEDKRIAVIGGRHDSVVNAVDFCSHFEGDVTLLTDGSQLDHDEDRELLEEAHIRLEEAPIERLFDAEGRLGVRFADGREETFDKGFFSLGWYKVNNELACLLGADTNEQGYVKTDANCEVLGTDGKPIRGLFAVGDLRAGGWKQIVIGWGDAETAVIAAYAYRLPA